MGGLKARVGRIAGIYMTIFNDECLSTDNIDRLMDEAERRLDPEAPIEIKTASDRSWKRWTAEEDRILMQGGIPEGRDKRSAIERRYRLRRLGRLVKKAPRWTPEEDRILLAGGVPEGRTAVAAKSRMLRLKQMGVHVGTPLQKKGRKGDATYQEATMCD